MVEMPHGLELVLSRVRDARLADDGESLRSLDAEFAQRFILRNLRELELQRPFTIYDERIMSLEPSQDGAGQFGRVAMVPGVRRSAHPVIEDARWRRCAQVENSLVEVPFGEGYAMAAKILSQRHNPLVILMNDIDPWRAILRRKSVTHSSTEEPTSS